MEFRDSVDMAFSRHGPVLDRYALPAKLRVSLSVLGPPRMALKLIRCFFCCNRGSKDPPSPSLRERGTHKYFDIERGEGGQSEPLLNTNHSWIEAQYRIRQLESDNASLENYVTQKAAYIESLEKHLQEREQELERGSKDPPSPSLRERGTHKYFDIERGEGGQSEPLLNTNHSWIEAQYRIRQLESDNASLENYVTQKAAYIESLEKHLQEREQELERGSKDPPSPSLRERGTHKYFDIERGEGGQSEPLLNTNHSWIEAQYRIRQLESDNASLENYVTQKAAYIESLEKHLQEREQELERGSKDPPSPSLRERGTHKYFDIERGEGGQSEPLLNTNHSWIEAQYRIRQLESDNASLENYVTQKAAYIESLEKHLQEREQELERFTSAVPDKDEHIERLGNKLEEQNVLIQKLELELQTCKADIVTASTNELSQNNSISCMTQTQSHIGAVELHNISLEDHVTQKTEYVEALENNLLGREQESRSYTSALHAHETDGRIRMLQNEIEEQNKLINKLENDLQTRDMEKEDALTRLSEVVALQVRDNNPDIVDLSDAFRPEKLADLSNNIYDNEWMDALDELPEDWTEQEQVALLLDIVMRCFIFCNQTGREQMEYVNKWMIPEKNQNTKLTTQKIMKDARRHKALEILPLVEKECFTKLKQDISAFNTIRLSITGSLHTYMKECVKLGWMMAVQDPPCVLACPGWRPSCDDDQSKLTHMNMLELRPYDTGLPTDSLQELSIGNTAMSCETETPQYTKGDIQTERVMFDKNVLKEYTHFGKYIAYVVWPYMLLHEGGQLLTKGVAQGCD